MAKSMDSEGLAITLCLFVGLFCFLGSLATGMGPVEFFFMGSVFLFFTVALLAGLAVAGLFLYKVFDAAKVEDGRTLLERLKDAYHWKAFIRDGRVFLAHVRQYALDEWKEGPGPTFEKYILPVVLKTAFHAQKIYNIVCKKVFREKGRDA